MECQGSNTDCASARQAPKLLYYHSGGMKRMEGRGKEGKKGDGRGEKFCTDNKYAGGI